MAIGRIPEPGTGIPESIIAAKGDILTGTANDTPAVLTVGANGTTLVADSVEATGLKWVTPAAGGKVLQVVMAETATAVTVASTTYTDTNLTATITPTLATSKILVIYTQQCSATRDTTQASASARLLRGGTAIQTSADAIGGSNTGITKIEVTGNISGSFLDTPNTTSSTTYKTQIKINTTANSGFAMAQPNSGLSSITLMEIGA